MQFVLKSLSEFHDYFVYVTFASPAGFAPFFGPLLNQRSALDDAFESLRQAFGFVEIALADAYESAIQRELLEMAHEFFVNGDVESGRQAMREIESTFSKSLRSLSMHVREAERRAHGSTSKHLSEVTPGYPRAGSEADLGEHQRELYLAVLSFYGATRGSFHGDELSNWLLCPDRHAVRLNERSRAAAIQRFRSELQRGSALAVLRAEHLLGDVFAFDIEQHGRPRVSIRGDANAFQTNSPLYVLDVAKWAIPQ